MIKVLNFWELIYFMTLQIIMIDKTNQQAQTAKANTDKVQPAQVQENVQLTETPLDYYEVLGLSRNAFPRQIERAYVRKSLQFHPGQHKDSKEPVDMSQFAHVCEAYQVLSDPDRRRQYDDYMIKNSDKVRKQNDEMVAKSKAQSKLSVYDRNYISPFSFRFHPFSPFRELFGTLPVNPFEHFNYFLNQGLFDDEDLSLYGWLDRPLTHFGPTADEFFGQKEIRDFMRRTKTGSAQMSKSVIKNTKIENGVRTTITETKKIGVDGNVVKEIKEEVEDEQGNKKIRYLDALPEEKRKEIMNFQSKENELEKKKA